MKIPDYEKYGKGKKSSCRQLYPFMPSDTFCMLICGPSGSGKTNTLIHMLMKPLIFYDMIFLYARNLEQNKYNYLISTIRKIAPRAIYTSNSEIIPVNNLPTSGQKHCNL